MQDHLYLVFFSVTCVILPVCLKRKSKRTSVHIVKELPALRYYYNIKQDAHSSFKLLGLLGRQRSILLFHIYLAPLQRYNHFQKCWDTSRFSLKYCNTSIPLAPYSMLSRNYHIFCVSHYYSNIKPNIEWGRGEEGGQILGRLIVKRPNVT